MPLHCIEIPFLLLLLFAGARAFTRDLRGFSSTIHRSSYGQELRIHFDPFLQNFDDAVKEICKNHLGCESEDIRPFVDALNIEYTTQINENIKKLLKRSPYSRSRDGRLHEQSRFEWLGQCDNSTFNEIMEIKQSSMKLWKILSTPASATERVNQLQQIASEINIYHLFGDGSPEDLLEAGFQLFNRNKYEHSLAIAIYLLFNQDEFSALSPFPLSSPTFELGIESKLVLFSLLSELYQISNDVEGVTVFYAKTLRLLSTQMLYAVDDGGQPFGQPIRGLDSLNAYLARMRVVLFMPILPSALDVALEQRINMISDIDSIASSIVAGNINVPIQDVVNKISATFFRLAHQGLNDRAINIAITKLYEALCHDFVFMSKRLQHFQPSKRPVLDFTSHRAVLKVKTMPPKYRIGFVSSHFFHHSIGRMLIEVIHFMEETISTSDRFRHFEVYAFFMTGSTQPYDDDLSAAFESLLKEKFIRIPIDDIETMRHTIGSEEYDLDAIIFTDVGMEMQSVILSNSRLAPIQIAWWGHPVTTASSAVDYYFGLDVEAPHAGHEHYTEQLVRHEWMNTAPITPLSESSRRELSLVSSLSYGIPENSKHFMILGRLFKVHPLFDDVLFDILMRTPANVYVVIVREKNNIELNSDLYQRLKRKQESICCQSSNATDNVLSCCEGMVTYRDYYRAEHDRIFNISTYRAGGEEGKIRFADPAYVLHRIRFVHYDSYVNVLMGAAAVLDTFPYGGCLTTHDALSNAIPMVTLPMEHVRGRYSVGMYRQMHHLDLVARNQDIFVNLAVRLVQDEDFRRLQSESISNKYNDMHRNNLVSSEWLNFLDRAIKQQKQK